MSRALPSLEQAKVEARALRQQLQAEGITLPHSAALERLAKLYGYRDWNSMQAMLRPAQPRRWQVGDQVSGHYLGQAFQARILQVSTCDPGWVQLVLDLDRAIDVVRFDSFSNLRKRLRVVVGPKGHSRERTSDGQPQARLDL